jgi:branched-chain amino acid transport system permease protein
LRDVRFAVSFHLVTLIQGLSYGLLLFLLASGLTLVYSLMGVMNFAHASLYMLGAYFAWSVVDLVQHQPALATSAFWIALLLAPVFTGLVGGIIARAGLRQVHRHGPVPEMLFTFGVSFVLFEAVQLVWGRTPLPLEVPEALRGVVMMGEGLALPAYRLFVVLLALVVLAGLALVLNRSRLGLLLRAATTHPKALQCLGHDVPGLFVWVFVAGSMLAGLAGALGAALFVVEPGMAASIGGLLFVVIVTGGTGSLRGALVASLLIGLLQTQAAALGWRWAPVLPYLLMVLVLVLRPQGLLGRGRPHA